MIGSTADGFDLDDVERTRMMRFALGRRFDQDSIERSPAAVRSVFDRFIQMASIPDRTYSLAEAADAANLNAQVVERFWNIRLTDPLEEVGDDDLQTLVGLKLALDAGFPEDALAQLLRVWADPLHRVAEAEIRLFHIHFHDRLRLSGLAADDVDEAVKSASARLEWMVEPVILYFHRKAWARALHEDLLLHLAEALGCLEDTGVLGQLPMAIAFVDLSSFTPLTEAMGDEGAATVIERFSEIVRGAIRRNGGHVVKQIGDGFMLSFSDCASALSASVEIRDASAREEHFPASRIGLHFGPVLYREGDYIGSVVNIASRLSDAAGRHQILVTPAVRDATPDFDAIVFRPLGRRALKGVAEDIDVFEVGAERERDGLRVVDPVCGMEFTTGEAAAHLDFEGSDRYFCSRDCLQLFVADPKSYGSHEPSPNAAS